VKPYSFIDADAHIEEGDAIWSCLDPAYLSRQPVEITVDNVPSRGGFDTAWLIDGKLFPQPVGKGATVFVPGSCSLGRRKPYARGSQDLTDIGARLREMDQMGIDVQVVFPTLFSYTTTEDPYFEAALYRSYNTWMAKTCRQAADRIKWNALMPVKLPEEAVKEARRAKALGATGAATYGTAGAKLLSDPSLDPFYETLCEVDLPLCVHVGISFPAVGQVVDNIFAVTIIGTPTAMLLGFYAIVGGGVLDRHPRLRVGFFELGSQWVPFMVDRMDEFYWVTKVLDQPAVLPKKVPSEYLRDGNLYLTCEAGDRILPQVLEMWGEDRVMLSSDMPHTELRDTEKSGLRARTDISESAKQKILVDNALCFYGLD
jgi:predicted TIM-barrel fold metal-dependent hydrolase